MSRDIKRKYQSKAKESFRTKKNLYLFTLVINRSELEKEEFLEFNLSDEVVEKYTAEYWQQQGFKSINGILIDDIYDRIKVLELEYAEQLKELEKQYVDEYSRIFPEKDFEKLLKEGNCSYCNITIEQIEQLADKKKLFKKSLRGWRLEIDRLNSNLEYTYDNCVMSCYWCNNAKTDEFTEKEFKEIGKVIEKIWKKRLNDC